MLSEAFFHLQQPKPAYHPRQESTLYCGHSSRQAAGIPSVSHPRIRAQLLASHLDCVPAPVLSTSEMLQQIRYPPCRELTSCFYRFAAVIPSEKAVPHFQSVYFCAVLRVFQSSSLSSSSFLIRLNSNSCAFGTRHERTACNSGSSVYAK